MRKIFEILKQLFSCVTLSCLLRYFPFSDLLRSDFSCWTVQSSTVDSDDIINFCRQYKGMSTRVQDLRRVLDHGAGWAGQTVGSNCTITEVHVWVGQRRRRPVFYTLAPFAWITIKEHDSVLNITRRHGSASCDKTHTQFSSATGRMISSSTRRSP